MGCCDKTKRIIVNTATKASHIARGFTALAVGMKCPDTDWRIAVCRDCKKAWWKNNKRSLWCKKCKCFIPAKARVQEEQCPRDKWARKDKR